MRRLAYPDRPRRVLIVVVVLLSVGLQAEVTSAQEGSSRGDVEWQSDWRTFSWEQGVISASLFAGSAIIQYGIRRPRPAWVGPVLVDDTVRRLLLADSRSALSVAAVASDILISGLILTPTVFDPAGAWIGHGDREVALQMSLISMQSMALTTFVTVSLKHIVGRQRPPVGICMADPLTGRDCIRREKLSFPSGHTSTAFTGAALICAHHDSIPLYGGGIGDDVACALSIAAATSTGLLRIVSNNHYFSDIMFGGALGFISGYLVPKWLHYGFGDEAGGDAGSSSTSSALRTMKLQKPPPPGGLSYRFRF